MILTESSSEITDSKAILSELKSFYSNLYEQRSTKTKADCLHYISNFNVPKLSAEDRTICEGKLSKKECYDALLSLGNNKSSGNDGLSKEFYVCFFNEIHPFLIQAFNYSFQHGELSISQRQAVITLIEKKGKDKRCIKNWRPISLMNVDTKIASKAIALKLKKVIPKLIQCAQTAYVNNRYIGEANRLISDMIEYTAENEIEGIFFSADFEKAFDSIEHTFIFATLQPFGFDPDFIQWVKTFLYKAENCAMNNGSSTGYFYLERGTRQGD